MERVTKGVVSDGACVTAGGGVAVEVQIPPFAPAYPGSHAHALDAVLPDGDFAFAGQSVQA